MPSPGVEKEKALRDAGFGDQEVEAWRQETGKSLSDAGFSGQEVSNYFGVKNPNMAPVRSYFEENLKKQQDEKTATPADGAPKPPAKPADTFLESLEAGWQMSVTGLIGRGKAPDILLPEHAPMAARIASQIGTLAGDVPAMIGGAFAGGVGGAEAAAPLAVVPGIGPALTAGGAAIGAGAGAFALPAAARKILMDHYQKGDIKDFGDFWERSSAVLWEAIKGGATGAATAATGGIAGSVGAGALTTAASEIATMVTVGKAMEGEIPSASDFLDAAILVGGMHASTHVAGKLQTIYAKTGMKPADVAHLAKEDPVVAQELLASGDKIPEKLGGGQKGEKVDASLTEPSNVLSEAEPEKVTAQKLPEPPAEKPLEPVERTPEEKAILDRIGTEETKKEPVTFDQFYTHAIDDLHPLKMFSDILAGEKGVKVKDDPYSLARLTRGAYGKADQFLEHSPFEFESLKNVGKSFKDIMEPVKGDLDGFRAFAIASRTLELTGRGIETGVPQEEAAANVKAGQKKYGPVFKELQDYQNHTLAYLRDSGILSKEAYGKMSEANQNYVPFYRLMDEGKGSSKAVGIGLKVKNPIKEIKGSERKLVDPLESIIKNTYAYITLAERNRVMTKMTELAERNPEASAPFMEKVPTPMKPIEIKTEEVAKFLAEHGLPPEDAEAFTVFRPKGGDLRPDEIAVYRDGKREIYKVNAELAKAVGALDHESAGRLMKYLSYPAKSLRAGSVLVPDFMARNLIRDQISAFNLSKHGFIPIYDSLRGLGSLWNKDEVYQDWLKGGGANSAMVALDRKYIDENIFKLSKDTGFLDKTWNVVKNRLDVLRVASELIENSTRLGEFKRAVEAGKEVRDAALNSREVTLDFARIGSSTRAMNMITAFWNANVQGLDRTARAFKEDPTGMTAKVAASITLPSVYLWWANHEDKRWKEIPNWQKDLFWIVMTKEHIYRIPKPFEVGLLFGSLPERALEAFFTDNPKAYKDFAGSMAQAFTPGYIPTAAIPIVEHFANKSTFTGGPIVPAQLEKILPEYQYTDYTTDAAKALGKMVRTVPFLGMGQKPGDLSSPIVIENYIRAWSGNLGAYALKLADVALHKSGLAPDPVKPADTLADIPFVKAFVIRYPAANSQSVQDFYENYNQSKTLIDTIKHLARDGDFENMQKELVIQSNQEKLIQLDGIQQAMAAQSKFVRMVNKNPKISSDQQRQLIDGAYLTMTDIAANGNKLASEFSKAMKESQKKQEKK